MPILIDRQLQEVQGFVSTSEEFFETTHGIRLRFVKITSAVVRVSTKLNVYNSYFE